MKLSEPFRILNHLVLCGVLVCTGIACPALSSEFVMGGIDLRRGPRDFVRVSRNQWQWQKGPRTFHVTQVSFVSGRGNFGLRHDYDYQAGGIGLSVPTQANWYQGGMLGLLIDGKRYSFLRSNNEKFRVSKSPRAKGMAAFTWENEVARVTFTFVMFSNENRLYLEVVVVPKTEIKSLAIRLQNYPSGFNHKPKHVVVMPERTVDRPGNIRLGPEQARWLFFSDADLDAARNPRAQGPSACAIGVDGLRAVTFMVGGYGIRPLLDYTPTTRRIRFCFWEFPGRSNRAGLAQLQREVRSARERMLAGDTFAWPQAQRNKMPAGDSPAGKSEKGQSHETSLPAKSAASLPVDGKVRGCGEERKPQSAGTKTSALGADRLGRKAH